MLIRFNEKSINIKDANQALALEVKFNLTKEGKIWKEIGDALYYNTDIMVDHDQFYFLLELARKHLALSSFTLTI
jgi:hypothetical protein